jgi:asparagine N-glycosylation enzyme membrane subunit Stt3
MVRFILLLVVIIVILFILRSRSKVNTKISQKKYKAIIITVIVLGLLFLIATSGRYILPQIFQLIKIGLPLLTKFIGI